MNTEARKFELGARVDVGPYSPFRADFVTSLGNKRSASARSRSTSPSSAGGRQSKKRYKDGRDRPRSRPRARSKDRSTSRPRPRPSPKSAPRRFSPPPRKGRPEGRLEGRLEGRPEARKAPSSGGRLADRLGDRARPALASGRATNRSPDEHKSPRGVGGARPSPRPPAAPPAARKAPKKRAPPFQLSLVAVTPAAMTVTPPAHVTSLVVGLPHGALPDREPAEVLCSRLEMQTASVVVLWVDRPEALDPASDSTAARMATAAVRQALKANPNLSVTVGLVVIIGRNPKGKGIPLHLPGERELCWIRRTTEQFMHATSSTMTDLRVVIPTTRNLEKLEGEHFREKLGIQLIDVAKPPPPPVSASAQSRSVTPEVMEKGTFSPPTGAPSFHARVLVGSPVAPTGPIASSDILEMIGCVRQGQAQEHPRPVCQAWHMSRLPPPTLAPRAGDTVPNIESATDGNGEYDPENPMYGPEGSGHTFDGLVGSASGAQGGNEEMAFAPISTLDTGSSPPTKRRGSSRRRRRNRRCDADSDTGSGSGYSSSFGGDGAKPEVDSPSSVVVPIDSNDDQEDSSNSGSSSDSGVAAPGGFSGLDLDAL